MAETDVLEAFERLDTNGDDEVSFLEAAGALANEHGVSDGSAAVAAFQSLCGGGPPGQQGFGCPCSCACGPHAYITN